MFEGFTPETIDFLWGIRLNNRRDWFEAHKQDYLDRLYHPMQELGAALYEPLREVPGMLVKVSRIYRDARYAHGVPYKEGLWVCLRRDSDYWAEHPCLFFDLSAENYKYGFLLPTPKADAMRRFRERWDEKPDEFLKLVQKAQADTGISLTGDAYCRKKSPADERIAPYYNLKNMFCYATKPIGSELFTTEIVEIASKAFHQLLPLHEYCQKLTGE